ncbi:MAG: patatin-like phospholipase family protein [Methylococcales bacterium]
MTEKKLGLALSGGGFRASFYHIGVLAQMAEHGLLRFVEVISTVSGGSIIGALYYLHVKKLLESKTDADITDLDYVKIVQQIEVDFLAATQHNIRMETFSSFVANLKMVLAHYSRSDRLAELYNDHFYQSVLPEYANSKEPLQMQQLKIYPDGNKNFHPEKDNALRKAKVPILILNATTLNTGRNWQFTASTMGEASDDSDTDTDTYSHDNIDKKPIWLRMANSYKDMAIVKDATTGKIILNQQEIPLGHAVAASACVPGLFPPMSITGLYEDSLADTPITPQLVDGGVFDNQGINGLLQKDCTCFVVSDATGQMGVENQTSTDAVSVLLRVSDILQDRVRSESLKRIIATARQEAQGINNLAFMDLRRGLPIREITWINENGKPAKADKITDASSTDFNVDPQVQERMSVMRTDLDAFSEVEAYSLMMDGYQMSEKELNEFKASVDYPEIKKIVHQKASWKFSEIAPWMENPTVDYLHQLEIGQAIPFKALKLMPVQLGTALVLSIVLLVYVFYPQLIAFFSLSISVYTVLLFLVPYILSKVAPRLTKVFSFFEYRRPQAELLKRIAQVVVIVLGTLIVKSYLISINKWFLKRGSLEELKKKQINA